MAMDRTGCSGDFAKCSDKRCPSRDKCLRMTAPDARMQDYADFQRPPEAPGCHDFIGNGRD